MDNTYITIYFQLISNNVISFLERADMSLKKYGFDMLHYKSKPYHRGKNLVINLCYSVI